MYVCMYACMYVCTYVRTYVCMYVCIDGDQLRAGVLYDMHVAGSCNGNGGYGSQVWVRQGLARDTIMFTAVSPRIMQLPLRSVQETPEDILGSSSLKDVMEWRVAGLLAEAEFEVIRTSFLSQ